MTFLSIYLSAGLLILILVTLLWGLSVILRDVSIVDLFWGAGFVTLVWFYFIFTPDGFTTRKWLIAALATIWGGRLTIYLFWRNWGEGEDFRYQNFRRNGGPNWWWRSLIVVFYLQGAVMWVVSAPLLAAQISPTPTQLTILDFAGIIIWAIGLFFEAVGDWQLARFKANPANQGKLLTTGVWRYTRHPNYFGDAAQWWGLFLIAAAATGGYFTIFSPIIMTYFLLRISGVAFLEPTLKQTKPGYEAYIASTSAFVPWFPRNSLDNKS